MGLFDKKQVVQKFKSFHQYVTKNNGQIGQKQRGIDLNLNNACNLTCEHCFTNSPKGEHIKEVLPMDVVGRIADEAHELGIFEFDLQGGELTLRPKLLYKVLEVIDTSRFYMYLTTNGAKLDQKMAQNLKDLGVDRVSVSIDSMNPLDHDKFRGKKGSWKKAIDALEYVKDVGIDPFLNITVGHYNAFSEDVEDMCRYSFEKGYTTLINVATPMGMWHSMSEIMCDEKDTARIIELRKKYKNILRNLWNPFDKHFEGVLGCNTVNRLYITPLGDVLPCPYVHIKIGNVFESSLKEISDYGFSIKYFNEHRSLCLAGEDKDFAGKFLSKKGQTIFKPALPENIFSEEEYVYTSEFATKQRKVIAIGQAN
jgi:MoaA/NifB/PqqE/SkfB family radical SAM enzyme